MDVQPLLLTIIFPKDILWQRFDDGGDECFPTDHSKISLIYSNKNAVRADAVGCSSCVIRGSH